jgi:hypothetical protein
MNLGITGAWYAYGDDLGTNGAAPGNCETVGMHMASQCSLITFPAPAMDVTNDAGMDAGFLASFPPGGYPGAPAGAPMNAMCLQGTGAKVIDGPGATATTPDYSNIFGIGIGLDFNNIGGNKMPYNATTNFVVGFSFTITGVPMGGIRVEFPTVQTVSGFQDSWAYTVTADGTYTAMLATTGLNKLSPSFNPPTGMTEPAFDPTMLYSIQFHVPTATSGPVMVPNMCVANLAAITM